MVFSNPVISNCEWREAANVPSKLATVHIDVGLVVRGPEMHKDAPTRWRRRVVELAPIPHGAFVVIEPVLLRVPVAGHHECRTRVEVVFDQLRPVSRFSIEEVAAGRIRHGIEWIAPVVVVAVLVRIDDDVPLAVQSDALPRKYVLQTWIGIGQRCSACDDQSKNHCWFFHAPQSSKRIGRTTRHFRATRR